MTGRLYIAAKAPRPGFAKTRLADAIGDEAAIDLYRAFLRDLASRFADAPFDLTWFVTPSDAWHDLTPLVDVGRRPMRWLDQGAGDWTTRQRRLLRRAAECGDRPVVLIGSDSPHVPVATIERAFALLDRHPVVLGPTDDGGYYLIGMRGWHDVLAGVPMSNSSVFERIVGQAERLAVSIGLVEQTFDVDVVAELRCLAAAMVGRDDLPATSAAMDRYGLLTMMAGAAAT
jgi:rSAM/selenodomain-associated transferase 1